MKLARASIAASTPSLHAIEARLEVALKEVSSTVLPLHQFVCVQAVLSA